MKEHQLKEGPPDLDNLLYRYVKEMLCDHTTYVICTNAIDNLIYANNLCVRNDVVDVSPTKKDRIIGVMVLEKNFKVKQTHSNCIIHYIYVLPKFRRKGFKT